MVRIITKERAKEIARDFIENYKVEFVYVTRDGNTYTGNLGFMKLHNQKHKLEPAWRFEKSDFEKKAEKKEKGINLLTAKLKDLQEYCEGKFPGSEWKDLKFPALRKYVGEKIENK